MVTALTMHKSYVLSKMLGDVSTKKLLLRSKTDHFYSIFLYLESLETSRDKAFVSRQKLAAYFSRFLETGNLETEP